MTIPRVPLVILLAFTGIALALGVGVIVLVLTLWSREARNYWEE